MEENFRNVHHPGRNVVVVRFVLHVVGGVLGVVRRAGLRGPFVGSRVGWSWEANGEATQKGNARGRRGKQYRTITTKRSQTTSK